jgi:type 1 glutamine amidotransferase
MRWASSIRVLLLATVVGTMNLSARAADPWIVYDGFDGPGKGKHIVLVSGDEEYRSEEALPQLGKILAKEHGFKCTVLFAIDKDGTINPNVSNIPGLEALKTADAMIIFTRFRDLPDEQMKHIVDFIDAGKPIIGLRTATHAFSIKSGKTYAKYSYNSNEPGYEKGFGKQILGETWVAHHGNHGKEGTRALIVKGQESNPILRGIKSGDIFGPEDVYTVHLPTMCTPILLGEVVAGLKPTDQAVEGPKNNPMMPVAWTKTYSGKDGKPGKVFATTMGCSQDLESEGFRRLLVNATYWVVDLEDKIPEKAKVDLVGEYKPSPFRGGGYVKGVKPADLAIK